MIDVSDFEEMEDVVEIEGDSLAWANDFLSGKYSADPKAAKKFLEKFRNAYDDAKKEIFALPMSEFKARITELSTNFYEFLALDWQNILLELVEKRSFYIFDFVLFLHEKTIFPENLEDKFAFKAYQNLLCDKKVIKELSEKSELSARLKIKTTESENWEMLESGNKEIYVLRSECASYVRSANSTTEEYNTLKIGSGIVKTNGLEFKSPLPFDEIVYFEV